MFDVFRASLRTGRVTTAYPDRPDTPPPAFRGRPAIDPARCTLSGDCARVCPSAAITIEPEPDGARRWQLDLARCVFCGLCADVCPTDALTITQEFELATRRRADLITGVTHVASAGCSVLSAESGPAAAAGPFPTQHSALSTQHFPSSPDAVRLSDRIRRLLRRSLHIRHLDAGSDNSTDWEINALLNPVYDVQRLGIDVVASPRHADVLLVTGPVTRQLEPALLATYEAMPRPAIVVAAGDEACGGGVWQGSYATAGGVDRVLPVDVYIPGDPPRPQALIHGLLVALDRLEPKLKAADHVKDVSGEIRSGLTPAR